MPTDPIFREESTAGFQLDFKDQKGDPVTPSTLKWTLTDGSGAVINNRKDVDIPSPANPQDIIFSGDDLALQSGEDTHGVRLLTVEATYDSDWGDDLPLNEQKKFIVKKLVGLKV